MSGTRGVSGLASQMFQSIWHQCDDDSFAGVGDKLADNFLDLLATSFGTLNHQPVSESAAMGSRRIMIREFIERNLGDPELSPALISQATQYSVPYLHELFRAEGETISRYIARRRLEASASALRDPHFVNAGISQIAYQWGFKNATHFGRCFKQQFGCTPKEYRLAR